MDYIAIMQQGQSVGFHSRKGYNIFIGFLKKLGYKWHNGCELNKFDGYILNGGLTLHAESGQLFCMYHRDIMYTIDYPELSTLFLTDRQYYQVNSAEDYTSLLMTLRDRGIVWGSSDIATEAVVPFTKGMLLCMNMGKLYCSGIYPYKDLPIQVYEPINNLKDDSCVEEFDNAIQAVESLANEQYWFDTLVDSIGLTKTLECITGIKDMLEFYKIPKELAIEVVKLTYK